MKNTMLKYFLYGSKDWISRQAGREAMKERSCGYWETQCEVLTEIKTQRLDLSGNLTRWSLVLGKRVWKSQYGITSAKIIFIRNCTVLITVNHGLCCLTSLLEELGEVLPGSQEFRLNWVKEVLQDWQIHIYVCWLSTIAGGAHSKRSN